MPAAQPVAASLLRVMEGHGSEREALLGFLKGGDNGHNEAAGTDSGEDFEDDSASEEETGTSGSEEDSDDEVPLADRARTPGGQEAPAPPRKRALPADADRSQGKPRKRRRSYLGIIKKSERCGHCHTCLNPQLKKACITVRAQREAAQRRGEKVVAHKPSRSSTPDSSGTRSSSHGGTAAAPRPRSTSSSSSNAVVDTMQTLVAPNGGLRSGSAVPTFLKLLQSPACNSHARKLACVVIESSPAPLRSAMAQGGILRTLGTWLEPAAAAATSGDSTPLSLLLDALHKLPVNRQLVLESGVGKQVGALTKAPGLPEQLRAVATQVKDTWLAQVKSSGTDPAASSTTASKTSSSTAAAAEGAPPLKKPKIEQEASAGSSAGAAAAGAPPRGMKLVTDDDIFKQPTSSTRTKVTPISRVTAVGIKRPLTVKEEPEAAAGAAAGPASPAATTAALPDRPIICTLHVEPAAEGEPDAVPYVRLELALAPAAAAGAGNGSPASSAARSGGVMQLLQRAAGAGGASTTRITGSRVRLVSNADGSSGSGGSKVVRLGSPPTTRQGTAGAGGSGGKKRVVWRDDRGGKLVAVRWFCKEDPASSASADVQVSEAQQRAQAARQHAGFDAAAREEHLRERQAMLARHQAEVEARARWRAQLQAMQPTGPWAEPPRCAAWDASWNVAAGEASADAPAQASFAAQTVPVPMGRFETPLEPPPGTVPEYAGYNSVASVACVPVDTETTRTKVAAAAAAAAATAPAAGAASRLGQPPPAAHPAPAPVAVLPPQQPPPPPRPMVPIAHAPIAPPPPPQQQQQQHAVAQPAPPPQVAPPQQPPQQQQQQPPMQLPGFGLDPAALAALAQVVQLSKQQGQAQPAGMPPPAAPAPPPGLAPPGQPMSAILLPDGSVGYAAAPGLGVSSAGGPMVITSGPAGLAAGGPQVIVANLAPQQLAVAGPSLTVYHPPPPHQQQQQQPHPPHLPHGAMHHPQQHHYPQQQQQHRGPYVGGRGGGWGSGGNRPQRVCKFHNTPKGCNKGDRCDFAHIDPQTGRDVREQNA